jgi:phospholipid/cholesterol/gamma-HCH transport system substrate-binding protein
MARAPRKRVLRKDRTGIAAWKAGLIAVILVAIGTYFGFAKHVPFTHGFRVKAVMTSANSIRKNSPVRIAGVNVGRVTGISRYKNTDTSVVTMEIQDKGLPIHNDAQLKIRPRIFLEGNFFVDLSPGTPSAPKMHDGDTIPVTQTSDPVQLDQVLTALQSDTRTDLQDFLKGYGTALKAGGAKALNRSSRDAGPALRDTAVVAQALLGTQPHDVSQLVASLGKVSTALVSRESSLKDLITNFNTTMAATAAESSSLQASIRELGPTLASANRALGSLNASFPPTRAFAREILPGVKATPSTINAAFPWIAQTRKLLGKDELRGLASELSRSSPSLAKLTDTTLQLLPQLDLVDKCLTNVILPAGDAKLQDGVLTTGEENYKEFWQSMVGLASEGQNFDGNGMYVRFQPGGGSQTVSLGPASFSGDTLFGNAPTKPIGTRPIYPGKRPPYKPDVPCYTQSLPDFNGPAAGPGAGP